jgi:hypothetical protein
MTTTTFAFPLLDEERARHAEVFLRRMPPLRVPEPALTATDPDLSGREQSKLRQEEEAYKVKARALAWILGSMQVVASVDLSRTIPDLVATTAPRCQSGVPVAKFYKRIEIEWSEPDYEVEQAIKGYLEGSHADR